MGVEKPNLCKDYDVLGFDVDHCLVKYNIRPLVQLMAKNMGEDLIELANFPEEIMLNS